MGSTDAAVAFAESVTGTQLLFRKGIPSMPAIMLPKIAVRIGYMFPAVFDKAFSQFAIAPPTPFRVVTKGALVVNGPTPMADDIQIVPLAVAVRDPFANHGPVRRMKSPAM